MPSRYLLVLSLLFLSACDLFSPDEQDILPDMNEVPISDLLMGAIILEPNPHDIAPLTATAFLRTEAPTTVSFEVLGAYPIRRTLEATTVEHSFSILGLYPDTLNAVAIRVMDPLVGYGVDTLYIQTDPLPEFFPEVVVSVADTFRMEPGLTMSSFTVGNAGTFETFPIMYDINGDIRWYMDLSFIGAISQPVSQFANGNLMFAQGFRIYEFDRLGQELNRWVLDGYFQHHDVVEKPNGNLIVAVDKSGLDTIEDFIIEVDRTTGSIVNEWDMRAIMDVDRLPVAGDERDWFHMNAIWYDEADDALIISGRNQGLVKVTATNELVWILAPHQGWGRAGVDGDGFETSDFLLTAVDATGTPYSDEVQQGTVDGSNFSWVWGQHAPLILPNGNIFVFDNGTNRNFGNAATPFSRGVEYKIDETSMTVQQVWQYGKERGSAFFANFISDVDYLPKTQNRLIMPGFVAAPSPRAFVTEVTYPGGDVVFESEVIFKMLLGNGEFGIGHIDIVYRSERLPLYPR